MPVTTPNRPPASAVKPFGTTASLLPLWQRAAARLALAAGAFSLVVAVALVVNLFHYRAHNPLTSRALADMKTQLVKDSLNEPLKEQIRTLDAHLRTAHERHLKLLARAQWLLIGGMAVCLASLQATLWRKKIARPGKRQKPAGWQAREIFVSSAAVVLLGAAIGTGAWTLVANSPTGLTAQLAQPPAPKSTETITVAAPPPPSSPFPSPEEVVRNWGVFRGPGGNGVSTLTNVPVTWNMESGEGVLWKVKAPGPDPNSPVVWDKRLFLTSGTAKKREVFCYDADTGKLLWQKPVENVPKGGVAVELPEISGGMACPTAATDGRRVYAMFANGDLAAFDYGGKMVWANSFAPLKNPYGHAASLALWQDKVIVQLDHGEGDEKVSRLVVLNAADGKVAWEKPRETHGTWSTPITIEAAGKPQIITLGLTHVIAYAAADGAELWRADGIEGEITPSPVFAGGLVLAPSPSIKLMAIRPEGAGDVTKTHVAWEFEEGVPDVTSPVSDGQRVYLVTSSGLLTAVDLKTGKKVWDKELDQEFKASPSVVGDRLYLVSAKGTVFVLATGAEFKELARVELADEVTASPAFADGRIYFRTKQSLLCVGVKK